MSQLRLVFIASVTHMTSRWHFAYQNNSIEPFTLPELFVLSASLHIQV